MRHAVALAASLAIASAASAQLLPVATIEHPQPAAGDVFGESVAVVGDYLCVGAPGRGIGGAVYVMNRQTGAFVTRIDPPADAVGGAFPFRIAAVGENRLATTTYLTRTAHLFEIPSGTLVRGLADPDAQSGGFAYSVASGSGVIAVGDIFEDNPGGLAGGRIQLYDPNGIFLRGINHPNQTGGGSSFPSSLQIVGDTIYAGSIYSRTQPAIGSGEGYAIRLSDGAPLATYPDATQGQNLLGATVALTRAGLAVGPGYDDGLPYGYLYIYSGTDPEPVRTFRSPGLSNTGANDWFGYATGVAADGSLLVGTPRGPYTAPAPERARGIVYRYDPSTGAELPSLLSPSTAETFSYLGYAIAVAGDLVYVGAPGTESSPTNPGRVHVYQVANPVSGGGFVVR